MQRLKRVLAIKDLPPSEKLKSKSDPPDKVSGYPGLLSGCLRNRRPDVPVYAIKCSDVGFEPPFRLEKWGKLEDMATLLPRDLYTLLSNLYGRLEEKPIYISDLGQVISLMESIIEKLFKYRKELRTLYEVRMSKEDRKAKKELLKSDKKAQKRKK